MGENINEKNDKSFIKVYNDILAIKTSLLCSTDKLVLCYILAKPDNWKFYKKVIAIETGNTEKTIIKSLQRIDNFFVVQLLERVKKYYVVKTRTKQAINKHIADLANIKLLKNNQPESPEEKTYLEKHFPEKHLPVLQ